MENYRNHELCWWLETPTASLEESEESGNCEIAHSNYSQYERSNECGPIQRWFRIRKL